MSVKDMQYVTVEQVLRLREAAIEAERERDEATNNYLKLSDAFVKLEGERDELAANAAEHHRLKMVLSTALGHDAGNPSMCDLVAVADLVARERDELAELLERARAAYVGPGQLSRLIKVGRVLNEVPNPKSLDRLKAQYGAQAIADLIGDLIPCEVDEDVKAFMRQRRDELRAQANEAQS